MTDERLGLPSASFPLRYHCLGAWNLIQALKAKDMIHDETNEAAKSGTRVHAELSGEEVELSQSEQEMRDTLERVNRETVYALLPGSIHVFKEDRIWLRKGLRPIFSGRYDQVASEDSCRRVALSEYKTGRVEVEPADLNLQMRDLAALWFFSHQETDELYVILIQPWISWTPSVCRYTRSELDEALRLLRENLDAIAKPDAPRTPGPHCRFCKASGFCDEAKTYGIRKPELLLEQINRGEITLRLGEQGARVLESIEVGYRILDKLWDLYEAAVLKDSKCVPGWYMADGAERREITDYEKARELLILKGDGEGLPETELDEATTFALGTLEKFFCNRAGTTQKKAKERFNDLLKPVIEIKHSKRSLKQFNRRGKHAEPPALDI